MKKINIFSAILALCTLAGVACDKEVQPTNPVHNFIVENVEITPSERSAEVVMDTPRYTIDGVAVNDLEISLQYRINPSKENTTDYSWKSVTEFVSEGNKAHYTLSNLTPGKNYELRMVAHFADYDKHSKTFEFETIAVGYSFNPTASITPYGYYVNSRINNLTLEVLGEKVAIEQVRLVYNIKGSDSIEEIVIDEFSGNSINTTIPAKTSTHLEENSNYECRVYAMANGQEYEAYNVIEFTTIEAVTSVAAGRFTARIAGGELTGNLTEAKATVDTHFHPTDYESAILYRVSGSSDAWKKKIATEVDYKGGFQVGVSLDELHGNTTYEVCLCLTVAGDEFRSSTIQVTTPESNYIIVPEPPVGGDTTTIAGTWGLVEWRGSEPSFDIYLVVNETGGITLWQNIDSHKWEMFQSAANINNGIISGIYTDGEAWGAEYHVTLEDGRMVWIDTEDTTDVSVYERCELPEEIVNITRANMGAGSGPRFL